jgi:hypothetical protein
MNIWPGRCEGGGDVMGYTHWLVGWLVGWSIGWLVGQSSGLLRKTRGQGGNGAPI